MIDLNTTDDQRQIVDSINDFLSAEMPIERFAAGKNSRAHERDRWKQMAELGWFSLGLPEAVGGVGLSVVEEVLLLRACGEALLSPSVGATVLAAHIAARARKKDVLQRLVAGEARVVFAQVESAARAGNPACRLIDCSEGDLVLVVKEDSSSLFEAAAFRNAATVQSIDESLMLHTADAPEAEPVAHVPVETWDYGPRAKLLLAAMLVGISNGALKLAVEYAKVRYQFGRPIGSFQAVKHMCADMAVRNESIGTQLIFATLSQREKHPGSRAHIIAAKMLAGEAAIANGAECIQIHGGIGFTQEAHAHRFLKRAHLLHRLGGDARRDALELIVPAAQAGRGG